MVQLLTHTPHITPLFRASHLSLVFHKQDYDMILSVSFYSGASASESGGSKPISH